jgi:hypothetical protein
VVNSSVWRRGAIMAYEVDLTVLSESERAEWARYEHMNNMPIGFQLRAHAATFVALTLWAVATVLMAAVVGPSANAGGHGESVGVASVVVIGGGLVGVCIVAVSVGKQALATGRKRLLERIDYPRRVEEARTRHLRVPGSRPEPPTLRQYQHQWYGDHSELNWTHRVQAEGLGIDDADTYVNNFLENDKD